MGGIDSRFRRRDAEKRGGTSQATRSPEGRSAAMTYDVMFVDDEPENLTVFEAACADRFSVLIASSARQALELLRQHVVCVLIADQRMPFMTGLELLERVRVEFPDVVRMLMTAYTDVKTAMDAINRGQVRRYLVKPW